jgi:hypothetical protein
MAPVLVRVISVLTGFVVGGAATFMVDPELPARAPGVGGAVGRVHLGPRPVASEGEPAYEILMRLGGRAARVSWTPARQTEAIRFTPYGAIGGRAIGDAGSRSFAARSGSRPAGPCHQG